MTPHAPDGSGLLVHLRKLAGHSAVYGVADVFPSAINLVLFVVYSKYLTPAEYGALALVGLFSAVAKIVFRLGVDSGFFRIHYDLATEEERRRLAGTVALFAAGVGALLFGFVAVGAGGLARLLSRTEPLPTRWLALAAGDLCLGAFAVVPQALLRIQGRASLFTRFALVRHTLNIGLKVVLVMRGFGVEGILWSDVISTGVYVLAQSPVLLKHASPKWSTPLLSQVLQFSLPKVPHGIMIQAQNLADRRILESFVERTELGLYNVGYTFGAAVKFPMSAFEQAWQPFVYSQIGKPGAPANLARVATYVFAAFVSVALAVAVLSREAIVLLTPWGPEFRGAAPVIPVVSFAYVFHGVFLLTSIGIGIEKKARYYPIVTAAAAATNIGANLLLIPRWGMMGAAWATVFSYAVMAALGFALSRRVYPIPFEVGRLGRLAAAALTTYALALFSPQALWPAIGVKLLILATFPALLVAFGFVRSDDLRWLRSKPWQRVQR